MYVSPRRILRYARKPSLNQSDLSGVPYSISYIRPVSFFHCIGEATGLLDLPGLRIGFIENHVIVTLGTRGSHTCLDKQRLRMSNKSGARFARFVLEAHT